MRAIIARGWRDLYGLQTAGTNLRMTTFTPFAHEVIDPRDAANTPLDSHIWEDEDFEEEQEEETAAALETVKKKSRRRKKKPNG